MMRRLSVMHPTQMLLGMLAVSVAFGLFCYFTNAKRSASRFRNNHPYFSMLVVLAGIYFIVYMLGSVIVFIFGILLPVVVTFLHASMRLRNIKNKLVNKIEVIGLKKTPMGVFLETLGLEQEVISFKRVRTLLHTLPLPSNTASGEGDARAAPTTPPPQSDGRPLTTPPRPYSFSPTSTPFASHRDPRVGQLSHVHMVPHGKVQKIVKKLETTFDSAPVPE
uniref:PRA1 family protein n=1 Tax=Timema monikensis TaxID=170555 RepID=A0A7R9HT86_9NEOP|nr:unnamed protein product [Timema monikensis]